jgi:hypothetical protein
MASRHPQRPATNSSSPAPTPAESSMGIRLSRGASRHIQRPAPTPAESSMVYDSPNGLRAIYSGRRLCSSRHIQRAATLLLEKPPNADARGVSNDDDLTLTGPGFVRPPRQCPPALRSSSNPADLQTTTPSQPRAAPWTRPRPRAVASVEPRGRRPGGAPRSQRPARATEQSRRAPLRCAPKPNQAL